MISFSNVFNFEDKQLRVYGTPDQPWFCGKDICNILGYKDTRKAIDDNVDDEYITLLGNIIDRGLAGRFDLKGNLKNMKLINEQGLYSLIFNSKLPTAKTFRKWVFEEVLPSIRKNGSYVDPNISNEQIEKLKEELQEKDNKIAKLEKKQLILTTIVNNATPLEKNQVFYIATTKAYASQQRFEYGGTKSKNDIRGRINTYNTGRAENDLMYICTFFMCHNYKQVESRLGEILKRFRDKQNSQKEMLFIRYDRLVKIAEFVCEHYNCEIDFINDNCQAIFDELTDCEPIVPEPMDLDDNIQIISTRGDDIQVHKICITGWTDKQFEKALIEILNICADARDVKHNFEAGDADLAIAWSDMSSTIKNKYEIKNNMMKWRDIFKTWYKTNNIQKLKVKGIKILYFYIYFFYRLSFVKN